MAARLIQRRQDQALADLGLTHAAVIALQGLTAGPLNQEHLAADIKVRSQSLGRVLARLEGAGLVTRRSSSRDRRSNDVAITDAGLDALAAAREVEKDALPPNLAEGAVLSRELARVISYFPGPHRARAEGRDNQGDMTPAGATEGSADRMPGTTDFDGDPDGAVSNDEAPEKSSGRPDGGRPDGRWPEQPDT
jgi:DNA-binding MarR family transcriptional regulator